MEYMGNCNWWNERFKERILKVMTHEKCLEEDLEYFKKEGEILDIACGDGRNSIYLSKLGYKVTSIDFSEEALKRIKYFAEKENLKIKIEKMDLSDCDSLKELGKYDGIIINHYRLIPELYVEIMKHLNEEGILWVNGFKEITVENKNIKEKDILRECDFTFLNKDKLEDKKEYSIDKKIFSRYIWRR